MTTKKPNIIFLVLDTHRLERMSVYGYHKDTTPVLGDLSEGATVFDWGIATAPWTVPSHASMFTGLYPTVHQTNQSYATLPEQIPTLAEKLAANGYETVAFCNNPLVGRSGQRPEARLRAVLQLQRHFPRRGRVRQLQLVETHTAPHNRDAPESLGAD